MSHPCSTLTNMSNPDDKPLYPADTRPEEWKNLPDDQVTACGFPLGLVHPNIYDENNQPRSEEWPPLFSS